MSYLKTSRTNKKGYKYKDLNLMEAETSSGFTCLGMSASIQTQKYNHGSEEALCYLTWVIYAIRDNFVT